MEARFNSSLDLSMQESDPIFVQAIVWLSKQVYLALNHPVTLVAPEGIMLALMWSSSLHHHIMVRE